MSIKCSKRVLFLFFLGLILQFLIFSQKAFSAIDFTIDSTLEDRDLEFIVGEVQTVKASTPTRVAVADPNIADVDKVEGDDIVLSAKKAGTTLLTIWDKYGQKSIGIRVYAENLENLQNRLKKLLANFKIQNLSIKTSREEGKIILNGQILSDDKKLLDTVLETFSDRIINLIQPIDQTDIVQIDVQVLELTKSATEELGISWLSALQVREEPYSSSTSTTSGITTTLNKIDTFAKAFRVVDWSRDALTAKLNMLISQGKGKVLSRPKLVCLSGKEAEFLVGGEIPIITTTTSVGGNVATHVLFRKYGVNLKVKPVVRNDDIDTTIYTEVSDVDWGNAVTVSGARIPAFASRSATTQVYLKDGQSVFLAGLIKNKDSTNIGGIPVLKDIPFLGAMFRSKSISNADTELVICLTPTIVKTGKRPTTIGTQNLSAVPPIHLPIPAAEDEAQAILEAPIDTVELVPFKNEDFSDSRLSYARSVQEKIAQAIVFPGEAKINNWEGMVKLTLHILSDGSLISASIKESSGIDVLDESAQVTAKKQAPFTAFPLDITTAELSIDVAVIYKLDSK
ncbi:MAG: TonB family protein [Candidatus Omnitrophota bacterium]|nr:TonB family protein [Candidatus Omnitrophota bacterium]